MHKLQGRVSPRSFFTQGGVSLTVPMIMTMTMVMMPPFLVQDLLDVRLLALSPGVMARFWAVRTAELIERHPQGAGAADKT
jgi:hypothetical protein